MTRILHIGKYYPPFRGGIENFMAALLPEQVRQGHEVAALVHGHQAGAKLTREDTNGVVIYRTPTFGRFLFTPIGPWFARDLQRVCRTFQPDVLHIHLPNVSAFWLLALRQTQTIPWIVHWHADVVASPLHRGLAFAYRFYRPLEQRLLSRANEVIVTSPPYLASSEALAPWAGKCRVVPLGIEPTPNHCDFEATELGSETILKTPWESAHFRILCVGRFTYYKGQQTLIEATQRLPADTRVLLVGQGERESTLRAQVRALGLQNRVVFTGSLSAAVLDALFTSCDVLCLPSLERTEAFGVVLLEAMRAGKPVVASDIPGSGIGWVVRHGETGLLLPPGDASRLQQALMTLRQDPSLRRSMGQNASARFQQCFTVGNVARSLAP